MDVHELNRLFARSHRRARRGRTIARSVFIATVGLVAFAVSLFVFAPGNLGPKWEPPLGIAAMLLLGIVGVAVGLLWMWRIVSADPEPDARSWRYRR